jgi:hypothetical protein
MAKNITTAPALRTLTATAVVADNTYNLSQMVDGSGRRSMNVSPIVINFDTTLNPIVVNLFALSTLLDGLGAGVGFHIHGTIVAGLNPVTFNAFSSESEVNTICGVPNKPLLGVGTAFMLWVSGRFNWGLAFCVATPSV